MEKLTVESDFLSSLSKYNKIGLFFLFLAKITGLAAVAFVIVGWKYLSFVLLGLDAIFLIITVTMCLLDLKKQNKQDLQDVDMLAKMLRDGTLQTKLRQAKQLIPG